MHKVRLILSLYIYTLHYFNTQIRNTLIQAKASCSKCIQSKGLNTLLGNCSPYIILQVFYLFICHNLIFAIDMYLEALPVWRNIISYYLQMQIYVPYTNCVWEHIALCLKFFFSSFLFRIRLLYCIIVISYGISWF